MLNRKPPLSGQWSGQEFRLLINGGLWECGSGGAL